MKTSNGNKKTNWHQQVSDGKPYHCQHTFTCPDQLEALKVLLKDMADRPQEYINLEGRFTNNTPEAYHNIALAYRDKRIDLGADHYVFKTNMSVLHKVNWFESPYLYNHNTHMKSKMVL